MCVCVWAKKRERGGQISPDFENNYHHHRRRQINLSLGKNFTSVKIVKAGFGFFLLKVSYFPFGFWFGSTISLNH